jgi:hypothetical protein
MGAMRNQNLIYIQEEVLGFVILSGLEDIHSHSNP